MKKVKTLSHGTAYFLKAGELCGSPLLTDGTIDQATQFSVEYSPQGFRKGHTAALKKLGGREQEIACYLNTIIYG